MSTITQIKEAIRTILVNGVSDIDQSALDTYLPAVTSRKVALLLPPMGMRGTVGAIVGRKTHLVHRIPCEFWVKVDMGDLPATIERGNEICLSAAAELQASIAPGSALNDTVTYLGDGSETPPFDWAVEEQMVTVGKASYIIARLFVTVTEWVVLQA